jgi:hypothetical protein
MANFNKGHEGLKNAFVLTPTSLEDPVLFNSHEGLKTIETYGGVPKEELLNHVLRVVSLTPRYTRNNKATSLIMNPDFREMRLGPSTRSHV